MFIQQLLLPAERGLLKHANVMHKNTAPTGHRVSMEYMGPEPGHCFWRLSHNSNQSRNSKDFLESFGKLSLLYCKKITSILVKDSAGFI